MHTRAYSRKNNVKEKAQVHSSMMNNLGIMKSVFVAVGGHNLLVVGRRSGSPRTRIHKWQPGVPWEGLQQTILCSTRNFSCHGTTTKETRTAGKEREPNRHGERLMKSNAATAATNTSKLDIHPAVQGRRLQEGERCRSAAVVLKQDQGFHLDAGADGWGWDTSTKPPRSSSTPRQRLRCGRRRRPRVSPGPRSPTAKTPPTAGSGEQGRTGAEIEREKARRVELELVDSDLEADRRRKSGHRELHPPGPRRPSKPRSPAEHPQPPSAAGSSAAHLDRGRHPGTSSLREEQRAPPPHSSMPRGLAGAYLWCRQDLEGGERGPAALGLGPPESPPRKKKIIWICLVDQIVTSICSQLIF